MTSTPKPPKRLPRLAPFVEMIKCVVSAKNGSLVRTGIELDSAPVKDLPRGEVVTVDGAEDVAERSGKRTVRAHIVAPVEGWVSKKTIEEYLAPEVEHPLGCAVSYLKVAATTGIAPRPNGLIAADDPLLVELMKGEAFEKHATDEATGRIVPCVDSWIVGDDACRERGIDLRYAVDPQNENTLMGVVRFSEKCRLAGSAVPSLRTVHGGVTHAVMDELMAELMKAKISSMVVTTKFSSEIKERVFPNITYKLQARSEGHGRYRFTHKFSATMVDPTREDRKGGPLLIAKSDSEQVDLPDLQGFGKKASEVK